MNEKVKLAIVICDRYHTCAGGKCLRALQNREGAFSAYKNKEIELVGYTTCDGCPGGNIEYAPEEMKKNGAEIIHFSTGMVAGFPPCPYLHYFKDFIKHKFGLEVVFGTHPIPQHYLEAHNYLAAGKKSEWFDTAEPIMTDKNTREAYD
ncbi:CGGC domain-containing protein [candidate division KSB1 bacterium]